MTMAGDSRFVTSTNLRGLLWHQIRFETTAIQAGVVGDNVTERAVALARSIRRALERRFPMKDDGRGIQVVIYLDLATLAIPERCAMALDCDHQIDYAECTVVKQVGDEAIRKFIALELGRSTD